jgi:hypothetical protein
MVETCMDRTHVHRLTSAKQTPGEQHTVESYIDISTFDGEVL